MSVAQNSDRIGEKRDVLANDRLRKNFALREHFEEKDFALGEHLVKKNFALGEYFV